MAIFAQNVIFSHTFSSGKHRAHLRPQNFILDYESYLYKVHLNEIKFWGLSCALCLKKKSMHFQSKENGLLKALTYAPFLTYRHNFQRYSHEIKSKNNNVMYSSMQNQNLCKPANLHSTYLHKFEAKW